MGMLRMAAGYPGVEDIGLKAPMLRQAVAGAQEKAQSGLEDVALEIEKGDTETAREEKAGSFLLRYFVAPIPATPMRSQVRPPIIHPLPKAYSSTLSEGAYPALTLAAAAKACQSYSSAP